MTHIAEEVKLGQLELGELVATARAKIVPVTMGGEPVRFALGAPESPVRCPFHPSAFGDSAATRVSMLLTIPREIAVDWIKSLESVVLQTMQQTPEKWAKSFSAEGLGHLWRSSLKYLNSGQTTLRCKINLPPGPNPARVWDAEGRAIEMPSNLTGSDVCAQITCKHVWVSSAGLGLLFEVTDLLLGARPKPVASPWLPSASLASDPSSQPHWM